MPQVSKLKQNSASQRKLADHLLPSSTSGALLGLVATTYEFDTDFFEIDFLPNVIGLGVWEDRNHKSRVALEKSLAELTTVCVVADAANYRTRPRSLRVEFIPASLTSGGALHSKLLLLQYEREIRLVVGSANLTENGYRKNIEVVNVLIANRDDSTDAPIIAIGIKLLSHYYKSWLTPLAERVVKDCQKSLAEYGEVNCHEHQLVFSSPRNPLSDELLNIWGDTTGNEEIQSLTIVSPFWSETPNQLIKLVQTLRQQKLLASFAEVFLISEAILDANNQLRPALPGKWHHYDPTLQNISVTVQAIDPSVTNEEAAGRSDLVATRPLHAKVTIFEGKNYRLTYSGSSNFTARGWALNGHAGSNIEAGLVTIVPKNNSNTSAIIPKVCEFKISLPSLEAQLEILHSCAEHPTPWPSFLLAAVLTPELENPDLLVLVLTFDLIITPEIWSILGPRNSAYGSIVIASSDSWARQSPMRIKLSDELLNALLMSHEIAVLWPDSSAPCYYPINADSEARIGLPTAPGSKTPGEYALLSYFQGRIAFEDMFPPVEPSDSEKRNGEVEDGLETSVDFMRIQSYIIREFVEALRGIRDELHLARHSLQRLQFALFGPVSPIALAREIIKAVDAGTRTPTAGAFQLIELIQCICNVRSYNSGEQLEEEWCTQINKAAHDIYRNLEKLKTTHSEAFDDSESFNQYEQIILKCLADVKVLQP